MKGEKPLLLITGAGGMIGSALAERLAARYRIVGFDLENQRPARDFVDFIPMDLTSDRSVTEGLSQMRKRYGSHIASVVHLAAYYDFSGEPSPLYHDVTVQGTNRLLGALHLLEVEQFVLSSTLLVHAPCEPGQKIDENWPVQPKWAYPKSKVATEEVLVQGHGDIPLVILRIAGIYDDRCSSIPIAHQIQRVAEKHMIGHFYPGDLNRGQAFLHREDLVDALVRVVDRRDKLPKQTVLLLGEPETIPYGRLQDELGKLLHDKEWTTVHVPKPVAKAGAWVRENLPWTRDPFIKPWMIDMADDHFELDISQAKKLLDWEPEHRLLDDLPKMIEALKADPQAWYREHDLQPAAKNLPETVAAP